jgi:RNA polymerase sigma-70 factor (ECF subfamily)
MLALSICARPDEGLCSPDAVDPEASDFGLELVRLRPALIAVAHAITGSRGMAEDLVQDTYRRALEHRAQFTRGSNLRAWLISILRNAHCDHVRRASHEILDPRLGEEREGGVAREPTLWSLVADGELARAVESLPPGYKEAFELRMSGLSYRAIARELGIDGDTVGTRLHRARKLLRETLLQRLQERLGEELGPAAVEALESLSLA